MISRNLTNEAGGDYGATIVPNAQQAGAPSSNIMQVMLRRRWWIVLCAIVSLGAALFYLSKQTPIYSSTSRVYVQEYSKLVGGDNTIGNLSPAISTQCELITSTPMLAEVISKPEIRELHSLKTVDNPSVIIQSGLAVVPDRDFINITYESPDPVEAAAVVNAIVEAYISSTAKRQNKTATEVLKILQNENDKAKKELERNRKETLDFRRSHGMLSFQQGDGTNIVFQKLSRLSESLTTTELDLMDAKTNREAIDALKNEPARLLEMARSEQAKDMEVNVDHDTGPHDSADNQLAASSEALRSDIAQMERNLDRLRRTRTPLHKDVQNAEADLALVKEQLARNESEILERKQKLLEQQHKISESHKKQENQDAATRQQEKDRELVAAFVARAKRREAMVVERRDMLQKNFDLQKKEAFDLNIDAAEYASKFQELSRAEKMVNLLEDRIKDIHVSDDTGMIKVEVVDVARPGTSPVRPDRKRILAMGLLLGIMLGTGLAFGIDFLDQRIRSPEEITALLGAPILGLVPNISKQETPSMRGRKILLEPTSDISEAYRTIRTAVFFAARDQRTKKILVTSPAPGDGKTTSASNLAIAMAQAGGRVLLLDADFRRPSQHKIFDIKPDVGLATVMSGLAPIEKAIHRTEVENLHLLPCGPIPSNPSEILNGQAFADMLETLERKYDHIIIDSPPVAPVTDARILGALCDETILVLRADKSTRRLSEHARQSLTSVGAKILGVIVNDVPRGSEGYKYYGAYGYAYYRYYRYGYGEEKKPAKDGNGQTAPAPTKA